MYDAKENLKIRWLIVKMKSRENWTFEVTQGHPFWLMIKMNKETEHTFKTLKLGELINVLLLASGRMAEESNLICTLLFSMTEYYQFTRCFQKASWQKSNDFKILFDDIYCSLKFFEYVDPPHRKLN